MLETFTVATFSPHVGEKFRVFHDPSSPSELTLASAEVLGHASAKEWSKASGREPFSLIFVGPMQSSIPQGLYKIEHDGVGPFELFMVPVGPGDQGMRYEVIFT